MQEEISDDIITLFALNNIGELTKNIDREKELVDFIRHINDNGTY